MKTEIILIRHGKTFWNQKKRMQGQVNIPLNSTGIAQAHELAEKLANRKIDICYSSPLSRAVDTARIALNGRDIPIQTTDLLVEHGYGLSEGSSYRHIPIYYQNCRAYNYEHHPELFVPAIGGETFQQVYNRAKEFISQYLLNPANDGRTILVASHAGISAAIQGLMFQIPLENYWSVKLPNCGYAIVLYENGTFTETERSNPGYEKF